jgi:hypothetical protein
MNFKIYNSKSKLWNNSCNFISTAQLQHYTSSPICLKDDAKQHKNRNDNNDHKRNTIKGGEVVTYGCVTSIVGSWKENLPS